MAEQKLLGMAPLAELIQQPKELKRHGFDYTDTKTLLRIPKEDRSPGLIEQLLKRHSPLASNEAKKLWKKYSHMAGGVVDFDDVLSAAQYGLLIAINRFDYRYNTEFSTYAIYWIRQAARREIENNIGEARIPVHFQEKLKRYSKEQDTVNNNTTVAMVKHHFLSHVSLDAPIGLDENCLIDGISNDLSLNAPSIRGSDCPEIATLRNDLRRRIDESIGCLKNKRNQAIVRMRYGINAADKEHTLEEVGEAFGITRERVRQITSKYIVLMQNLQRFDSDDFTVFRSSK